ncbi:MAG: PD-(D/E)XK nuclease-like domain-containing protein [Pseudomonadota bacterium]|nr:PD-(D/E)XK nuclease-like domain-containing protein [Pseudomonadota bacterium]
MITEPGIYSLPAEQYHADPCPEPSLSGSVAIPLVHRSPRHAWYSHPRLNPRPAREESKRLDFGSAAHKMVLGEGADIEVIDADNYTTKAARESRDLAREAGRIPLLTADYEIVCAMTKVAHETLSACWKPLSTGKAEQAMIWQEKGAWCRGMVDWLSDDLTLVLDYKTVGASANPTDVERHLFDQDYHLKAAFYERGLNVLDPNKANIGRRGFYFMFQEIEPPYCCSLLQISEGGMTIGRKQITFAIRQWADCMKTNIWPGYPLVPHTASVPPWIERQWLERENNDPLCTGATSPDNYVAPYEPREIQNTLGSG